MSIFSKILPLRYSIIIFASLIVVILSLLALFLFDVLVDPKWSAVIPGLLTGFVIALFQALLSWYEIKKVNELKELKVRKILPSREDPVYYGSLISRSKKEIKLLGVTAQRFLDDFGSDSPNAPEHRKVLIKTLNDNDNINIKLLLADYDSIKSNEDNKNKYNLAQKRLEALSNRFPGKFEYRYYKHEPTHSVMIIDNECIVGPIFPHVESKYTPAIHLRTDSAFAKHYIEYFDNEWNACKCV